jgi:alpha-amylase
MKYPTSKKSRYVLVTFLTLLLGCSTEEEVQRREQHEIQVTNTPNDVVNGKTPGPGGGVLMQAFYWDVPAGGNWWNTVKSKLTAWDNAGYSAIWLPPVSKAQNGAFSMGYDPFDYYDFGSYNQMGSVETRFGSLSELNSLISTAHTKNIQVYADIVINHNSGGASEYNPFTGGNTWTDFNPLSNKFFRSATDFHPNNVHSSDIGSFGGFPDLCHDQAYVKDWLWIRTDAVGKYYKNTMKFDGWRFDYVKGFNASVVRDWMNNVGGFAVGEYWDGNAAALQAWVNGTSRTSSAFDFACFYAMDAAFDGNNLNRLNDDMLWKRDPTKTVTFVANHDTDIIYNSKLSAYAYIMTHEGYPCVFYRDYEEWLNKAKMDNLIWIHRNLAVGNTSILYVDGDEYIARRNGSPGLVIYINNSNSWQQRWIQTNWANTGIHDYTGHSGWWPTTQGDKWVQIQAPPKSYSVWSLNGL